jgi:hypothetical protein
LAGESDTWSSPRAARQTCFASIDGNVTRASISFTSPRRSCGPHGRARSSAPGEDLRRSYPGSVWSRAAYVSTGFQDRATPTRNTPQGYRHSTAARPTLDGCWTRRALRRQHLGWPPVPATRPQSSRGRHSARPPFMTVAYNPPSWMHHTARTRPQAADWATERIDPVRRGEPALNQRPAACPEEPQSQ